MAIPAHDADPDRFDLSARAATATAFDRMSPRYDALCGNEVMAWMRARVHALCAARFPAGSRVLEIGCGSGIDAAFLASRGVKVVAADPSAGMRREAEARLRQGSRPGTVELLAAGLDEIDDHLARLESARRFDGIFSNFGALNCVDDLSALGELARHRLESGGSLVLCFLGRLCPWEIAYFLCRLDPASAMRRLRRGPLAVNVEGIPVATTYHTAQGVMRTLGPEFRLRQLTGLAILVPPPWLVSWWAVVPPPVRAAVAAIDARLSSRSPLNRLGDHFLIDVVKS